ncbi:olfactory receptor 52E8-like [Pseudophryne corroboree]|uniref:olfactory receptor 52E8-like n=1 Tax=Pseudophryne corroboree TaxID=495146 RepID=UPI003081FB66
MEPPAPNTSFSHTYFTLCGFPGIVQSRRALFLPFFSMYMILVISNGVMIYTIWLEKTLHSPMYTLIALLFAGNLSYTTAIMPRFLLELTFDLNQITLTGCLLQMFVVYLTGACQSSLLVLMALDRYVAVIMPLRYHRIVTKRALVLLVLIGWTRSLLLISPIILVASEVQFCRSNIIFSFACEYMSLLNLACGDTTKVQVVGLWPRVLITVIDGTIILVSYVKVLSAVRMVLDGRASDKAWQTCSTQLLVGVLMTVSGMCTSIVYRLSSLVSYDVQNLVSLINFVIPSSADPIIYGLKMREIRNSLKKIYGRRHCGACASNTQTEGVLRRPMGH